jgi:hypothetical protein
MDIQLTGTVTQILPEQAGEGRNGPWRKQEFILETPGEYARQVCIVQWGDNIDKFGVQEGETVTVAIDLQSREYNGRWYTDVKAWRVERPTGGGGGPTPPPASTGEPWPSEPPGEGDDDDLPF